MILRTILILALTFGCSSYIPRADNLSSKNGYLLVVPAKKLNIDSQKDQKIILIDKIGKTVKEWKVNFNVLSAVLDDEGNIYIEGEDRKVNSFTKVANGVVSYFEIRNKNDEVTWKYRNPLKHHDFKVLPNKNIAFIEYYSQNPKKYGFKGKKFYKGKVWPDRIIEINPKTNKVVWSWDSHKHINLKNLQRISEIGDLLHCNSLSYISSYYETLKPAYILSCKKNSTVYIIDKESKKVLWSSPEKLFIKQHDATFVNDHTVLAFSNGFGHSSVIEYNIKSNKKTWEYTGGEHLFESMQFYSSIMSGAQRLKNGNTVITLGTRGYVVEVNRKKEVVWNYLNTHFLQPNTVAWPYHSIFKARMYDSY
jgi:hypothetical protein